VCECQLIGCLSKRSRVVRIRGVGGGRRPAHEVTGLTHDPDRRGDSEEDRQELHTRHAFVSFVAFVPLALSS
jgi:hypothetical protein